MRLIGSFPVPTITKLTIANRSRILFITSNFVGVF